MAGLQASFEAFKVWSSKVLLGNSSSLQVWMAAIFEKENGSNFYVRVDREGSVETIFGRRHLFSKVGVTF